MRFSLWLCSSLMVSASALMAADVPLVESYLHSGKFDQGEQVLERRLAEVPQDQQARFGLGVLQFFRGVERLGQGLHYYGVKNQGMGQLFLRFPVPEQKNPAPIGYREFRRLLDDFRRDLALAEGTLAAIEGDQVQLPLRLAEIHLDLDHDGKATDRLLDIMQSYNGRRPFPNLAQNPDFLVKFDRGDVAWLRAYCHLLMGVLDIILGVDSEATFNWQSGNLFANPRHPFRGTDEEKWKAWAEAAESSRVIEPLRWARARQHYLKAAELNHEVWQHIRKETDNDFEWLPNPRQTSVLGMRVEERMIDAWLALWDELTLLLNGNKTLPYMLSPNLGNENPRVGVNVQRFLDDPPETSTDFRKLDARYFSDAPEVDVGRLIQWYFAFGNSPIPMAIWFN